MDNARGGPFSHRCMKFPRKASGGRLLFSPNCSIGGESVASPDALGHRKEGSALSARALDYTMAEGENDQLSAVVSARLRHHFLENVFHSLLTRPQVFGDSRVCEAACNQGQSPSLFGVE